MKEIIPIACDHAGFELKTFLMEYMKLWIVVSINVAL